MRIKYLIPLSLAAGADATAQTPATNTARPAEPVKSRADAKAVLNDVRKLASKQLGVPVEKILPNSRFVQDLGLDSLDAVELVLTCEEFYQIVIPDEQLEKAYRISDLVEVIIKAPAKQPAEKMTIVRFKDVSPGLFVGKVEGKKSASSGLLYDDGRVLLPPTYDDIYFFFRGYARVWLNKLAGVIDSTGKLVIPLRYAGLSDYHNGYFAAALKVDNKLLWGLLDRDGNTVIDFQYEEIKPWEGYWLPVKKAGRWAFVNLRNEIMADPGYTNLYSLSGTGTTFGASDFSANYCAELNGKLGVISPTNEILIPFEYDAGSPGFCNSDGCHNGTRKSGDHLELNWLTFTTEIDGPVGYATVRKNKLWGIINTRNEIVVPFQPLQLDRYDDRYERVRAKNPVTGKWGFLGKGGHEIVPVRYDGAENYFYSKSLGPKYNDKARVRLGGKTFKIDLQGNPTD